MNLEKQVSKLFNEVMNESFGINTMDELITFEKRYMNLLVAVKTDLNLLVLNSEKENAWLFLKLKNENPKMALELIRNTVASDNKVNEYLSMIVLFKNYSIKLAEIHRLLHLFKTKLLEV